MDAVKKWPTPKSSPSGPDFARMEREGSGADDLATAVAREMFATPKGRDWKGQSQRGIHRPMDALGNTDRGDGQPIGGQLNPQWVELLMAWPKDWTKLDTEAAIWFMDQKLKGGLPLGPKDGKKERRASARGSSSESTGLDVAETVSSLDNPSQHGGRSSKNQKGE